MKTLKLIKRDFLQGTWRHKKIYIFPLIIFLFICFRTYNYDLRTLRQYDIFNGKAGFLDYLLFLNPGMPIFRFTKESIFKIPLYWFGVQFFIHYIIAYYPEEDYSLYGKNTVLSTGSRYKWWLSKCVWCTINVAIYYLLMVFTAFAATIIFSGEFRMGFSEDLICFKFGQLCKYMNRTDVILITLILPFCITLSLCLLQMLLSFMVKPVTAFAAICGIYVLSAYYFSWLLPGSFTMWIRSSYMNLEGITPKSGFLILGLIILASVLVGSIYFEDKDII